MPELGRRGQRGTATTLLAGQEHRAGDPLDPAVDVRGDRHARVPPPLSGPYGDADLGPGHGAHA